MTLDGHGRLTLRFEAELWRYDGEAAWYFVTLPADLAEDVSDHAGPPAGFGSVRVAATVGSSHWQTSLFPDRSRGSYLLPVKKAVRERERLEAGAPVEVEIVLG